MFGLRISFASVALGVAVFLGPAARAWGPEGHTVVGRVAVLHLTPAAKADFDWIVAVGVPALNASMPDGKCQIDPKDPLGPVPDYRVDGDRHTNLANWADCYRAVVPGTPPHFDDIPLGDTPTGPLNAAQQPWCSGGCVSTAFADNLRTLAQPGLAPADAARALAYVVHFVGDMHQPLHTEDNGDRGGNDVHIDAAGTGVEETKLHALWDTSLVEVALGKDLNAATATVKADVAAGPETTGNVDEVIAAADAWIETAHSDAQAAYGLLMIPVGAGPRQGVHVGEGYLKRESRVARRELDVASLHLAGALNAALTWTPSQH